MRLDLVPALTRPDLLADPVAAALRSLSDEHAERVHVAPIDPGLADTAAFCAAYDVPLDASANCVVVTGKRGGEARTAACLVLATTRADVNGLVRRHLDVRKVSFAAQDDAVAQTGMQYGGITPLGLPPAWPVLLDAAVAQHVGVVVGSGLRTSKLLVPGEVLAALHSAEVLDGLGVPVTA